MTFDTFKGQQIEETEKLLAKKGRKPKFCREQRMNFLYIHDAMNVFEENFLNFTKNKDRNFKSLQDTLKAADQRLKVVRHSWGTFLKWGVRDVIMISEDIGVSVNYIKSKTWLRGSIKIGDKVMFDESDDREVRGLAKKGEWEVLGFNNKGIVIKSKDGSIVNKDIQLLEDEMQVIK